MTALLIWASVQLAATMSPGPAFIIAVRTALSGHVKTTIALAAGLATGVCAHVTVALAGMSLLITQSPFLYKIVQYIGAAYLIYIGVQALWAAYKVWREKRVSTDEDRPIEAALSDQPAPKTAQSLWQSYRRGLLTNLLNPKALVFFTAVLSQFITPDMSIGMKFLYGVISTLVELLWFSGVGIVLSRPKVRAAFLKIVHWVDGVFGGLIVGLGIKLASSAG